MEHQVDAAITTEEPTERLEQVLGRNLASNEFAYCWEFDEEGSADCQLEYTPAELGGFAHPDVDSSCYLADVFVGSTSIWSVLKPDQRKRIEGLALANHEAVMRRRECEEFDAEVLS